MKKRKGNVGEIVFIIIGILSVYIVVMAFFDMCKLISDYQTVHSIARTYLLEMETVGYLTPSSRAELLQDLSELQADNIDLSGTTLMDAGYGNRICLRFKCDIPVRNVESADENFFGFIFEDSQITIKVHYMSTAKR